MTELALVEPPRVIHPRARIVVIDDDPAITALLEAVLAEAGYEAVESTTRSAHGIALCAATEPDVVLLDLHMPAPDGFTLLRRLREISAAGLHSGAGAPPVIVLTADYSVTTRERALAAGATDIIAKPFEAVEVLLRVRNALNLRTRQIELEERVETRTAELERARFELLQRLALTSEYRDDATGEHTRRVGAMAGEIARALCPEQAATITLAAPLHDIGKVGIPDAILLKPSDLTPEEEVVVRQHVEIGQRILADSTAPVLHAAEGIAYSHHERWDGSGYPRGLAGEAIPLSGRITAVADVYDALTHARPYKDAWPEDAAREEIARGAGTQFDPAVVAAFLRCCASALPGGTTRSASAAVSSTCGPT